MASPPTLSNLTRLLSARKQRSRHTSLTYKSPWGGNGTIENNKVAAPWVGNEEHVIFTFPATLTEKTEGTILTFYPFSHARGTAKARGESTFAADPEETSHSWVSLDSGLVRTTAS